MCATVRACEARGLLAHEEIPQAGSAGMMRAAVAGCAAVMMSLAAGVGAQSTLLPPACAGMKGDQLDRCVRDVTLPEMTTRMEPVEAKPDPAQPVNCRTVVRADEDFCIARNEIVLECRNGTKHPDFEQCATPLVMAQPKPPAADCMRVAPARRQQCEARNKVYLQCTDDPLRYFICLAEKMNAR